MKALESLGLHTLVALELLATAFATVTTGLRCLTLWQDWRLPTQPA
jgi:hypothetical protein